MAYGWCHAKKGNINEASFQTIKKISKYAAKKIVNAFIKAQSHISSRTSIEQKNEEFWSVRCDLLGVRQNSLMI